MAMESPTSRELDAFRDDADRFIAELDEEYYLHLAGHKETLELEPIYERHEELTRLDTARRLEGAPTELWRFACEGYLGALTREHAEKIAEVEAGLEADVDGEKIPYRMLRPVMSNEARPRPTRTPRACPARPARRAPEPRLPRRGPDRPRGRVEARLARTTTSSTSASASGSTSSPRSARRCSTRPRGSGRPRATASSASGSGSRSADARPADVSRLFRAPELDIAYPADRMLPALEATLADLGIDLRSQSNVHLDLEQRPGKDPARVLLADRGAGEGDARDPADRRPRRLAGALPRGRATPSTTRTPLPTCRWRPGGSATWP